MKAQLPKWITDLQALRSHQERLSFAMGNVTQDKVDVLVEAFEIKTNELKAARATVRKAEKIIKELEQTLLTEVGSYPIDPDIFPVPTIQDKDKRITWSEKAVQEVVAFVTCTPGEIALAEYRRGKAEMLRRGIIGGTTQTLLLVGDA